MRKAFVLITAATASAVVAFACFPSPVLLDDETQRPDGQAPGEGGPNGTDGGTDALSSDGSPNPGDGAPQCDADPCDCDNDGFKGAQCDGGDCDDLDNRRFPDAAARSDLPPTGKNGDWNCDGTETPSNPVGVNCANLPTNKCADAGNPFLQDITCGQLGTLQRCGVNGGFCDNVGQPGNEQRLPCR